MSNIYQFLFSRQTSYSNCWIRCFDVFDNFHSPSKLYGREIRLWRRMLYSTVLHLFSDSIVCWTCMCCVGVSLQNSFVLFLNWILYRFSLEELDGTKYCIHIVAMLYLICFKPKLPLFCVYSNPFYFLRTKSILFPPMKII